ncbi:MAG TPA: hypothetical protein VET90_09495 [Candidatus Binatus sp.]|nr:hypothetical protein [Candidatus Binatus sp.]
MSSALGLLPGGILAWSVPAAALGIPGLLLLVAILSQAVGAFAWIPIARRKLAGVGVAGRGERAERLTPPDEAA